MRENDPAKRDRRPGPAHNGRGLDRGEKYMRLDGKRKDPFSQEFLSLGLTSRSIALTRHFAGRYGLKKGTPLPILVNGHPRTLMVACLLSSEGPAQAFGGNFDLMDIAILSGW